MNFYWKYEDYNNWSKNTENNCVPQRPFDKVKKMIDLWIGRAINDVWANKSVIEGYCKNRWYNIIDIENSIAIKSWRLIKIKVWNKKVYEEEINKIKYKDGIIWWLYDKVMWSSSMQKYQKIEATTKVNRFVIIREDWKWYYALYRLGCFEYDGIHRNREQRKNATKKAIEKLEQDPNSARHPDHPLNKKIEEKETE